MLKQKARCTVQIRSQHGVLQQSRNQKNYKMLKYQQRLFQEQNIREISWQGFNFCSILSIIQVILSYYLIAGLTQSQPVSWLYLSSFAHLSLSCNHTYHLTFIILPYFVSPHLTHKEPSRPYFTDLFFYFVAATEAKFQNYEILFRILSPKNNFHKIGVSDLKLEHHVF